MRRGVHVAMGLVAGFLWLQCGTSETGTDSGPTGGDVPSDVSSDQGQQLSGNAAITGKVVLVKDFRNQVVDLLRQYLSSNKLFGGDLYLELCSDQECTKVVTTRKVVEDYGFSTGFPKDVSAEGLPAGTFYARFVLDTRYSQEYGSSYADDGGAGPLDVLECDASAKIETGKNPAPVTFQVDLKDNESLDVGQHTLGSIVFEKIAFEPQTEDGRLLVAASGKDVYRNVIKVVDLSKYQVASDITMKIDGSDFNGDICGFVRGGGNTLYVVGVGGPGAYVTTSDLSSLSFGTQYVLIPHPDYQEGGSTDNLDPEQYPWPCRGVYLKKGDYEFLYLIAFKGAGAMDNSAPYPLVIVDVTGLAAGSPGKVVQTLDKSVDPFFDETARLLRGVATDGSKVYFLEPSWSKLVDKDTVYVFTPNDDGTLSKDDLEMVSSTAEDRCDSTNHWVPGLALARVAGKPMLFVGNDDSIEVFDTQGNSVTKIDTTGYGTLITSFALSPDGTKLYAMPNCKSATTKAHVAAGNGDKTVDLDRHAIAVLDITKNPPVLVDTEKDFDGDGNADGGIDLEFLYLKHNLLRWCETCSGVVPPTAYTGPEIAVGQKSVFMRGTGIQSDELNSSGLGQVADLGVYDLASGLGILFRDYNVWLDGPSARWGFDLDPSNPTKTYEGDVSTAALLYLPGSGQ